MSAISSGRPGETLVSIIVPSYNQGRFIAQTLDSILEQSHRPLEVIVVDGASTDNTKDILTRYAARHPELRWISEKDTGPAEAVNKGLSLARGEVAAIQSSDDLYQAGAIADVVRVMQENPDCAFVYGDMDCIDGEGRPLGPARVPEFSWEAFFGIALCIPQSSIFFRARAAREVGGWNGAYYGADLDLWLKLLLRTRPIRLARSLSVWRIYAEQRTRPDRYGKIWRDYCRMIAESQDVRRASPRVRRLARASCHILALKMHPTGNPLSLRWHAFLALLSHPTYWRYQWHALMQFPELRAIRGLYRSWARLQRVLSFGNARQVP